MDMERILALILTIVVEYLVLLILWRKQWIKLFGYSILVNALTNPLANFIYHQWCAAVAPYAEGHVIGPLIGVEIGVVIIETFLIALLLRISYRQGLYFSIAANLVSACLSFLF